MTGFSDLISQHLYRFLPRSFRENVAKAQQRALHRLPENQVEVYCFTKDAHKIFPDSSLVTSEQVEALELPQYSLICTIKNEEAVILAFLDSIVHQYHLPSEIIICDGGSTDGTVHKVNDWIQVNEDRRLASIRAVLIEEPSAGIAEGRNIAVSQSRCELLAFADAGTTLDKQWSERLLAPFAMRPELEVSMGWYKPVLRSRVERALARFILPHLNILQPETFLPSARSLAIKKQLFNAVGGYPEHLTFAGEDSLFDIYLKSSARHLAFVPDAICFWRFPNGPIGAFKAIRAYAKGDGESGQLWDYYMLLLEKLANLFLELGVVLLGILLYLVTCLKGFIVLSLVSFVFYMIKGWQLLGEYRRPLMGKLAHTGMLDFFFDAIALKVMLPAQAIGFIEGVKSWPVIERRRISGATKGHLILMLPEIHFYEPQSPTTQRVLQLLDQGWYLTVVYAQSVIQSDSRRVAFRHPQLENHLRSQFYFDAWLEKHQEYIEKEGRPFVYFDMCNDGLSKDLIKKLEKKGAQALQADEGQE